MDSMTIRPEILAKLREQYPAGCTVVLEQMSDPYREMPAGMTGNVIHVYDAGGIHVDWSNGSTLAAIHGFDRIRRID